MHQQPRLTTVAIPSAPVPDTYQTLGISKKILSCISVLINIIVTFCTCFNISGICAPILDKYSILGIVEIIFGCLCILLEIIMVIYFSFDISGNCDGIIVSI